MYTFLGISGFGDFGISGFAPTSGLSPSDFNLAFIDIDEECGIEPVRITPASLSTSLSGDSKALQVIRDEDLRYQSRIQWGDKDNRRNRRIKWHTGPNDFVRP